MTTETTVTTTGSDGGEEGAGAAVAAAEAGEAAAEAGEAAAEAGEAAAEAGEAAAESGGEDGATDREVAEAERLAVLEWAHAVHEADRPHLGREDMESVARSVLWQEAEDLAQYAADLAAAEAAAAEAQSGGEGDTVVVTDVPASETTANKGLRRFF